VRRARGALRVVAFGGGTGLPVLLRGLRQIGVGSLAAVVTVADDGGSSGRLRQELGVAPPGDLRNCLVALADRRQLAEVFDYRFEGGIELRDHSVGNIIIAALSELSGGICEGVAQAGRLLRVSGSVLPAATSSVTLVIEHADGSITRGESSLREAGKAVRRVRIDPAQAQAPAAVIEAIDGADVTILSAGSLFTSTIPSLLGAGVAEALARFRGPVIYIANVMTQPGETVGFTLSDHVRAIAEHVGPVVSEVLADRSELPAALLARYRAEGAAPVVIDPAEVRGLGARLHLERLVPDAPQEEIRHDPARLARAVHGIIAGWSGRPAPPPERKR
jgi:uncharacterized cofD-like protein